MKKILKFNEMMEAPAEKYTLRGLVLGEELDGKYKMTTEGLHAVYKVLYNGEDVDGAFEFAEYLSEDEKNIDFVYQHLSEFIYDKLIDDATEKEILQTIFDGEHLNYLGSRGDMFEEFDSNRYDTWVMEVADLIGLGKYFNEE